jgi:hypothetical protein
MNRFEEAAWQKECSARRRTEIDQDKPKLDYRSAQMEMRGYAFRFPITFIV